MEQQRNKGLGGCSHAVARVVERTRMLGWFLPSFSFCPCRHSSASEPACPGRFSLSFAPPSRYSEHLQEVFLRCWGTQEGLPEVQNLRAWIFRVGLNAAKDLQRSAWRRRVKPLLGAEIMPPSQNSTPAHDMEECETLEQLRQALFHLRPGEMPPTRTPCRGST